MQRFSFPLPEAVAEMLDLINAGGKHRLSLVDDTGVVHGFLKSDYGERRFEIEPANEGFFLVLNGAADEQREIFGAGSADTALIFLAGCFYGTFNGADLEQIHEESPLDWEEPPM